MFPFFYKHGKIMGFLNQQKKKKIAKFGEMFNKFLIHHTRNKESWIVGVGAVT